LCYGGQVGGHVAVPDGGAAARILLLAARIA
jgi:hypothetical protein